MSKTLFISASQFAGINNTDNIHYRPRKIDGRNQDSADLRERSFEKATKLDLRLAQRSVSLK